MKLAVPTHKKEMAKKLCFDEDNGGSEVKHDIGEKLSQKVASEAVDECEGVEGLELEGEGNISMQIMHTIEEAT